MAVTAVQACAWSMLLFSGVWTGVILTFAVERTNLWSRMPVEQYAVDFRRSLLRVDPMQPILAVAASIPAATFAWLSGPTAARWLTIAGLAVIVAVVASTIAIAEPINTKFRGRREGDVPEDADRLRGAWRRFHNVRTVMAVAAFALLCAAAIA